MFKACQRLLEKAVTAWLLLLLLQFAAHGQLDGGALPPGVRLLEDRDLPSGLPLGYVASGLAMDWTHPLLKVTPLADGALLKEGSVNSQAEPPPALRWSRLQEKFPKAVLMQLIEPRDEGTTYPLGVQLAGGLEAGLAGMAFVPQPHVEIGQSNVIRVHPSSGRETLAGMVGVRARMGTRWSGPLHELDTVWLEFRERLLVSVTGPAEAETRWVMVYREDNGRGTLDDLREWMKNLGPPGAWCGIHSAGPQVTIGQGDGRLGPPPDPRRAERVGAVLALDGIAIGDAVDWGRLRGNRWQASSAERDFPAVAAGSGLRLGNLFAPQLWMSREMGQESEPWLEVSFNDPRPIDAVHIYWAAAAGWDGQFNPADARLEVQDDAKNWEVIGLNPQAQPGARQVHAFKAQREVTTIRVVLPSPESGPTPIPRARVVALQAWGPWDGVTQPEPR